MARFQIQSRKFGEITFRVHDAGGYVRVSGNGWDNKQVCEGGSFGGVTLMSDEQRLEKTARRWWAAFLRVEREFA